MLNCQNNLGNAYLHLERYEDAAVIFKELTKSPLYTSPWLAFVNLGWAYYQMGMTQEAIDETETAVSLNPDLCLGYKLPGAGGGGYLYMVAKDPEAAARIRTLLTANPLTPSARFVDLTLSDKGLQVTRS